MRRRSSASSERTYSREPTRPSSSAAQKPRRTFEPSGRGPMASAASISVATPLPLSLMPGPPATESR